MGVFNFKDNFDSLVVGCGLVGSVIARFIAEKLNKRVIILERRDHIAGNMYDYIDSHGILVHKYGPHTFHTNHKYLYDFMTSYSNWEPYKLTSMALIDGIFTPVPFNFQTIDDFYDFDKGEKLKAKLLTTFPGKEKVTIVELLEQNEQMIKEFALFLFEKDYRPYTAKQWGIPPEDIDLSVLKRVPIRLSYDVGYFDDPYQVMPRRGYTEFFKELLNHPNIQIELNVDALEYLQLDTKNNRILYNGESYQKPVIYTGALDELLNLVEGELPYRSLHFEWFFEDIESFQGAPVVAYPQEKDFTRITEYKKLPVQKVRGTTYAKEYPLSYQPGKIIEPYYPVLTENSKIQHKKYQAIADRIENLIYCGRLADFNYYNMDQALARALEVCKTLESKFV